MADEHTTVQNLDRRQHPRSSARAWKTAITHIEPNRILIRGYHVDEMMARVSFSEAIYLLLMGELPTPAIGKMISAILVSSVDHGATPPSTTVARNVATTGAPSGPPWRPACSRSARTTAVMSRPACGCSTAASTRSRTGLAPRRRPADHRHVPRSGPTSTGLRAPVAHAGTRAPCG